MARIRNPKDFWAGLLFILRHCRDRHRLNYTLGTAARMGPGYFPRMLGMLLIVLGGDSRAARSLRTDRTAATRMEMAARHSWRWAAS